MVTPEASDGEVAPVEERLQRVKKRLMALVADISTSIVRHRSVAVGILQEVENHDVVVIGATRTSVTRQILFGSIPENIAKHAGRSVIVVKRYQAVKELVGRVMSE